MLIVVIVACEVGFWVAVAGGLALRYLAGQRRAGAVVLALAPVIDAVLLAVTALDLARGGRADWMHGLAALYIGVSLAYGRRMVAWADARFAHWRQGRPLPPRPTGWAHTRACWADVVRTLLAVVIAGAVVGVFLLAFGTGTRTAALVGWFPVLGVLLGIELLWAISYTVWPRRAR
ncbi:hypothetical protein DEJ23_00480 [Curtobacterium sp. MCSS17_008]|uniref:hypothetical protein n=1 Tax=Curtobacterium sp. MCSS17_008 TaxID=2175647 RepID=UPI000DA899DD|nr:hypothetical protein [Curtobacterium sp. MCSS17_008]PZF59557.1 hypothetical protein DEJ23_00480 [Curtobacterium sp. MCSS17_008]